MPDTQNDDLVLVCHIINHEMGLVGMDANRRRDLLAQATRTRIIRQKRENRAQSFVIGVSLWQTELFHAIEKNGGQIVNCGAC